MNANVSESIIYLWYKNNYNNKNLNIEVESSSKKLDETEGDLPSP